MEKCLLLGNGGREAVMAEFISNSYSLYSVLPYENPSIIDYVEKSNGKYIIASPFDKQVVEKFIQDEEISICAVSSDNLSQDGLIDLAKSLGLKTFGATSMGSKIEWSKSYALDIVKDLAPEMIIKNYNITDIKQFEEIERLYLDCNFVVKPEGLTGGKGVKVGGVHFKTKEEGFDYAKECFEKSGNVIIQDKVEGREFTVMCLTDGKNSVVTPVTFDYPYRFDQDKGPGTGGMGCMSFENGLLPFLTQDDVDICSDLINKVINKLNEDSFEFNGVLYGGFFKCQDGIKFIEFNARFGDPESINVLNALKTPFDEVFTHIINGDLSYDNCKFKNNYTFMVYVVSKDYAIRENKEPTIFTLDKEKIENLGAKVYFANAKKIGENKYTSVSNSRLFGVFAEGNSLEDAKAIVYNAMKDTIDENLDYRTDIGTIYAH